jgi:hypothetical protein
MNHFYELAAPILNVGAALALLVVLVFLLLGPLRKYWIIAAYAIWELFATAALTIADVRLHGSAAADATRRSAASTLYARLYWSNDVLDDLFRFVLVIVLIYWSAGAQKKSSARMLGILVLLMAILPFVLFNTGAKTVAFGSFSFPFPSAAWFNSTSELLNFGAAIMNLMLWATLIASKRRDAQLLTVSAGLGLVVTGTALAYGWRHLAGESQFGAVAAFFLNLIQLAGWTIWCWAFAPARSRQPQLNRPIPSP